jgi:hypothetical protein
MLSDAVMSGKPVGLIPLEPNRVAGLVRLLGAVRGKPLRMRDLRKFWDDLRSRGVVGTIEQPLCGPLEISPMETAVAAIQAVLEGRIPEQVVNLAPALPELAKSAAPAAG